VRVRTPRREKGLGALEPIFLAAWLLRELYPRKRTFVSGSGANRVVLAFRPPHVEQCLPCVLSLRRSNN
jgi:hypothetical protein